jgi:hypothetical protein
MDNCYTLEYGTQETITAQGVTVEEQSSSLSDVTEYAVIVELEPDVVLVTEGEQGPPGVPGAPGPAGGQAVQRTAGEAISALRAVYELDGLVYIADAFDEPTVYLMIGVAISAAAFGGALNIQRSGEITDSGWNWTPGLVWLGSNGALTQTPPVSGFSVNVGVAVSPTRLWLNLDYPINLGV